MKKKLIFALCAMAMAALVIGCGDNGSSGNNDSDSSTESSKKKDKDKDDSDKESDETDENVDASVSDENGTGVAEDTIIENASTDDFSNAYVGGIVTFGTYEQDGDKSNGPEPIEWEVLDINENGMLLVSRYVIEAKPFNNEHIDFTWETCSLRGWLNEDFLNKAFDSVEQTRINETTIINNDNPYSGADGGNDTIDKIFLLSLDEILAYYNFSYYDEERQCGFCEQLLIAPTEYAINAKLWGVETIDEEGYEDLYAEKGYSSNCIGAVGTWWWLRSPSSSNKCATEVRYDGFGGPNSNGDSTVPRGVRPALYLQQ